MPSERPDTYSAHEIALAAGVPEEEVRDRMPGPRGAYVAREDALAIARAVVQRVRIAPTAGPEPLFSRSASDALQVSPTPIVWSATVHALLAAIAILVAGFTAAPRAILGAAADESLAQTMRVVFLQVPGPGGGGGGGGTQQTQPAPPALTEGRHALRSPLPARAEDSKLERPSRPLPLDAEPLPTIVAPVLAVAGDDRNRPGVLDEVDVATESRGSGRAGGAGSGIGTGLGSGVGGGIGAGAGGGTGGGPYRPGSGIDPPRLVREVKADYTEEARQRGITGEVVLEIVVTHDGTVGDMHVMKGLAAGLNDRALEAVRQWRFTPATRQGTAVDVVVEVAVEFKLR